MDFRDRIALCAVVVGLFAITIFGIFTDLGSPPSISPAIPQGVSALPDDVVRRSIRPIPEVISRPKPFRVDRSLSTRDSKYFNDDAVTQVVASNDPPVTKYISFPAAPFTATPNAMHVPAHDITSDTTAEIHAMIQSYLRAFNRHDAHALAAHWSDDGESIELHSGEKTEGRDAVAGVFATLFEQDAAASIDITIESIHHIRDDVAVVDGLSLLSFNDATQAKSRFSAVVVREKERWVLSSVREASTSSPQPVGSALEQLAWLAGSWEDIDDAISAHTHCSWNSGRSFLNRSHSSTFNVQQAESEDGIPALLPIDGSSREISEVIGWDSQRQQIRSWIFTSDGRFAEGFWTQAGNTWQIEYEGRGADEGTSCVMTIKRLGPDEIVVQSEASLLSDILPPVTDFVRTAYLAHE
ncbi:MAG: SgcJ/EcaC family oxidoreductase [Pirellulales bacterium]